VDIYTKFRRNRSRKNVSYGQKVIYVLKQRMSVPMTILTTIRLDWQPWRN